MSWKQYKDLTAAWANSAAQDTVVNVDLLVEGYSPAPSHQVIVHNPGAVAITVKINSVESMNGNTRYALLGTLSVPAGQTKAMSVDGFLQSGLGGRLICTNDAAVGGAGAFSADIRVRSLRS